MAGLQGLLWLAGPWTVKGKRIQTNAKKTWREERQILKFFAGHKAVPMTVDRRAGGAVNCRAEKNSVFLRVSTTLLQARNFRQGEELPIEGTL